MYLILGCIGLGVCISWLVYQAGDRTRGVTDASTVHVEDDIPGALIPWIPDSVPEVLNAGGRSLPVRFESPTEVTEELARVILFDLNLIYGHLDSHEVLEGRMPVTYQIDGRKVAPDSMIILRGHGRFSPKEHAGQFGFLLQGELMISSDLVDIYRGAVGRMQQNRNAYGRLLRDIAELNGISEHTREPSEWFWMDRQAREAGMGPPRFSYDDFTKEFSQHTFLQPSLLDVFEGSRWDVMLSDKLVAKVYATNQDGEKLSSFPPMIFDKEKWKFLIGVPPT